MLFILLMLAATFATAQDIELNRFDVFSDGKHVQVQWVLAKGSVCTGIKIYRSTDSNNLQQVGFIDGICGSIDSPVGYTFTDSFPIVNKLSYYAIKPGSAPVTAARSIFFVDDSRKHIIYPNPARGQFTVIFNDGQLTHSCLLYDIHGRLVKRVEGINAKQVRVDVTGLAPGLYFYRLNSDNTATGSGKIVILQ